LAKDMMDWLDKNPDANAEEVEKKRK